MCRIRLPRSSWTWMCLKIHPMATTFFWWSKFSVSKCIFPKGYFFLSFFFWSVMLVQNSGNVCTWAIWANPSFCPHPSHQAQRKEHNDPASSWAQTSRAGIQCANYFTTASVGSKPLKSSERVVLFWVRLEFLFKYSSRLLMNERSERVRCRVEH